MRTQVAVVDVFQGVTFTPTTDWRDFRPHGRRVTWREEGSPTVWYTYVLEDDYDSEAYDLEKLEGQPIPEEYYRIPYESAWTEVKGPLRSDQFLKVVEPTRYLANGLKLTWPATELREEILIHEQLKDHPHPSIVKYHGVQVADGYVAGIVLDKLDVELCRTIGYATSESQLWTVEKVVQDLKEGLEHLHSLGIVHGDVSTSNIMLDHSGRAVLIDFDSAFHIGSVRYGKQFHGGYLHSNQKYSRPAEDGTDELYACAELDLDCLALVHDELVELDKERGNYCTNLD